MDEWSPPPPESISIGPKPYVKATWLPDGFTTQCLQGKVANLEVWFRGHCITLIEHVSTMGTSCLDTDFGLQMKLTTLPGIHCFVHNPIERLHWAATKIKEKNLLSRSLLLSVNKPWKDFSRCRKRFCSNVMGNLPPPPRFLIYV